MIVLCQPVASGVAKAHCLGIRGKQSASGSANLYLIAKVVRIEHPSGDVLSGALGCTANKSFTKDSSTQSVNLRDDNAKGMIVPRSAVLQMENCLNRDHLVVREGNVEIIAGDEIIVIAIIVDSSEISLVIANDSTLAIVNSIDIVGGASERGKRAVSDIVEKIVEIIITSSVSIQILKAIDNLAWVN